MKAWRCVATIGGLIAGSMQLAHAQQSIPSPSQVAPPEIRPAPSAPTRIVLPRVEVGQAIPEQAKKLSFVLVGFDIEGEFAELAAARRDLERSMLGKRVTVAQVFEFGAALQAHYVRAGYPLVRVIVSPQELDKAARVKIRVVDGFVERIDAEAIAPLARPRVLAVLQRLVRKPHLTQGELERQLLIAGESPGLELNAVFTGGKEIGGSILVLSGRYKAVSASIYGDNGMPAVFGTGQFVTAASLNGVLGLGEQISVSASGLPDANYVTTNPTRRYLTASVMIPLGVDGWRVEASGTQGKTTPRVDPIFASQGLLAQGRVKLAFDALKRRDAELTLSARLDSTDEEVDSLLFTPAIPLSRDRLRVVRAAVDGIWRLRETGTVVSYGATVSRGLDALGARMAAQASPLLPLSRAGADAVFTKLEGRFQISQSLPENFFLSLAGFGQTSFDRPLLKSEQYDLVGAQMLSGYNAGSFAGDSAWITRAEIGRNIAWPSEALPMVLTPYLFGATGERILIQPSTFELASLHASNLGGGLRIFLPVFGTFPASFSGFVEGARQHSNDPTQQGWRLFAGGSLRY